MDWSVGDYDWDDLAAVAAKREGRPRAEVRCQVEGCTADMQELRPFYQRLRICETHAKAHSITDASGRAMRFCQQCSKLQPLKMFEGGHRSCAASLDKRRARRSLAVVARRRNAATSDTEEEVEEEEEEEQPVSRQPKRRATRQESGSASGSAGSNGEHCALPSTVKLKLGSRSRGSPSRRARSAHRRRDSNASGVAAAAPSSAAGAAGAASQGLLGASPEASAVLFGGLAAEAPAASGTQLPLPLGAAGAGPGFAAGLPLPTAQHQQAALLGGAGSGAVLDLNGSAAPGAAVALLPLALSSAAASQLPGDVDDLDLLLQLSPEVLADVLLADCDSQSGNSRMASGQPLIPSALHTCSWPPPPPMAMTGPASGAPAHTAAAAANSAFAGSPAPGPQSHGPGDSRGSGSGGPEDTRVAQHLSLQAAGSNSAAWAGPQAGYAQAGLPGWPGQQGGDQLVTLCIKLFGATPDQLPADLQAQLQMAMTLTPTVLQATLRHGCLCLTVTALLSPAELERMQNKHPSGFAASVAAAVAKAQAASGAPDSACKLLVQAGSQLAAAGTQRCVVAAQPLPDAPGSTAARLLAAPRLITPHVLCSVGGSQPIQLVLVGPGLADPSVALHCRSRGRHQVVTMLRVRRSAAAAGSLQEPATPPPADRRSADSGLDSNGEDEWAPSAAGPAAADSSEASAPTAAEVAFEAATLAPGEDALLVQLSAPAQGWGLCELETAAGPLLSRAVPLLVLTPTASAAADELAAGLAGLPPSEAASLLLHLGFAMQAAELAPRLQEAAVQRVSRLACALALACGERSWVSAARLLLPAIALAVQPGEGCSCNTHGQAAGGKDGQPACSVADAMAGLRACKGMAADQQQRLDLLLARMAAQESEEAVTPQQAQQAQHAAPARPAARLSDWFWAGCNLAAGAATAVLLIRNLTMEGPP